MKKLMAFVLALLGVFLLTACGSRKGQDYLNAEVLEITETEILAVCIDAPTHSLVNTTVRISKDVISADGLPEMEAGSKIRVVFASDKISIQDDSLAIKQVYAIYLLDENGDVIPNSSRESASIIIDKKDVCDVKSPAA